MSGGQAFDVRVLAFSGEPLGAVAALQRALPIDQRTARRLVDGAPLTVKRAVDRTTAAQYLALLEAAGAQVEVVRSDSGRAHGAQDAPAMAGDPADFVGPLDGPAGDAADVLSAIEPLWRPEERDSVEQARAAALSEAFSLPPPPSGASAAGRSSVASSPVASKGGGWGGLPDLPDPPAGRRGKAAPGLPGLPELAGPRAPTTARAEELDDDSLPPALLADDDSLPPALLSAVSDRPDEAVPNALPGLMGNDGALRAGVDDAAAPGIDLAEPRKRFARPGGAAPGRAEGQVAQGPAGSLRPPRWARPVLRSGRELFDRAYAWAEDNSDEPDLERGSGALARGGGVARREFAVFAVWLLELLERAWERAAALARHLAGAARAGASRGPDATSDVDALLSVPPPPGPGARVTLDAEEAAGASVVSVALRGLLAAGVFVGFAHFDDTILRGNASLFSICAHAAAIYALGRSVVALHRSFARR